MDWITPLLIFIQGVCTPQDPCLKLPEVAPPEPPAIVQTVQEEKKEVKLDTETQVPDQKSSN